MRWLRRSRHKVVLYSKPGCHLCDDVHTLLERLGRRYPLEIQEVDIRQDPVLFRRYDIRIPVLVIDGERELEAPITERDLRRALRSLPF